MRKKLLTLIGSACLILVLAALPFMTACPAPPAEEEEPTPSVQPITLRFAEFSIPSLPRGVALKQALREIEVRSEGQVKIDIYWEGSLLKATETGRGVIEGMADMGSPAPAYEPSLFPLSTVCEVMLLTSTVGPFSQLAVTRTLNGLYEENQMLQDEYSRHGLVYLGSAPSHSYVIASTSPVRTPEDLKGKKFRTVGAIMPRIVQEYWGGAPVFISFMDAYEGMSRGIVDCLSLSAAVMEHLGLWDVAKYVCLTDFGVACTNVYVIRKATWDKLPKDIQELFMEVFREEYPEYHARAFNEFVEAGLEAAKAAGVEVYTPTPEEMELWHAQNEEVAGWWIEDMVEERGFDEKAMREFVDLYLSQYEKWLKE